MSQDYTIKAVSSEPREWEGAYGKMLSYHIQVEGNGEPVTLNKKPDSPAPQVGDVIYGDVVPGEFGQRFKAAKKPFAGYQRDDKAIQAQWAIGQAREWVQYNEGHGTADIENEAKQFFGMIERIKNS